MEMKRFMKKVYYDLLWHELAIINETTHGKYIESPVMYGQIHRINPKRFVLIGYF